MKKSLMFNLSRTSTTSIIAILLIVGVLALSGVAMFHKVVDTNLATLIIGQLFGLACFVAGYYFNKKQGIVPDDADPETDK